MTDTSNTPHATDQAKATEFVHNLFKPFDTATPEPPTADDIHNAALRSRIGEQYGISTHRGPNDEPSDAELFLTGTDETTIEAQAKRLHELDTPTRPPGNIAPREGQAVAPVTRSTTAEVAAHLFGRDN